MIFNTFKNETTHNEPTHIPEEYITCCCGRNACWTKGHGNTTASTKE